MHNNQDNWDKLFVLSLCELPLNTRRILLKQSGITLPEILERVSSIGKAWKGQAVIHGHDLRQLRLSIEEWTSKNNEPIKDKILEALRVMKIGYVFQIYGYPTINSESFSSGFRRNFSKDDADLAEKFIEVVRHETRVPPFESIIFEDKEIFWLKKTWGM